MKLLLQYLCILTMIFTGLFALCQPISAAVPNPQISVKVDRKQLAPGESLTLNITSNSINTRQPDLSPLQKDFQILGVSQSSNISILNGQQTTQKNYRIELVPRHPGKLLIPSLLIANQQSQPIPINVSNSFKGSTQPKHRNNITITAKLNHTQTYVGAQTLYTVEIQSPINIAQAQLFTPNIPNATIKPFGQDRSFERTLNHQIVDVFQRRYVITPNTTGTLKIDPTTLVAYIPMAQQHPLNQNDLFNFSLNGFAPRTKRISLQSSALTLRILPAPTSSSNWLPAYQLKLSQSWSDNTHQWRAGNPITRRIEIKARGIDASKLPEITMNTVPGVNLYPDQQQQANTQINNQPWARTSRQFAVVPTHSGLVTFPAIQVKWWNMHTKKFQTSVIPKQSFTILAALNANSSGLSSLAPTHQLTTLQTSTPTSHPHSQRTMATQRLHSTLRPNQHPSWLWLAIAFGLLWLLTLTYFWWARKPKTPHKLAISSGASTRAIKQACLEGSASDIKSALLKWSSRQFPTTKVTGLEQLKQCIDDTNVRQQLDILERHIWSSHKTPYDQGEALWQALQQYLKQSENKSSSKPKQDNLPPLYDP